MKRKPVEARAYFVEEHTRFVEEHTHFAEVISQILMLFCVSQEQKAVKSTNFASTELLQNQGL